MVYLKRMKIINEGRCNFKFLGVPVFLCLAMHCMLYSDLKGGKSNKKKENAHKLKDIQGDDQLVT